MCVTCGCSSGAKATLTDATGLVDDLHEHTHRLVDDTVVHHAHTQGEAAHQHTHLEATAAPEVSSLAQSHGRTVSVEQNLLAKNDQVAAQNRAWLAARQIVALNLVSSPGAGKTTLLTRTIQDLQAERPIAVIEGDQETTHDADRIRATGCPAVQVNTGTGCHLEAAMVQRGLTALAPPNHAMVIIENVGNLVCPALFDLGETAKVTILSVTEGEDKPIKYPHMFRASQVMVLNKIDLLPYVQFDVARCLDYARQVNPTLAIFQVSATRGDGLGAWYDWLRDRTGILSSPRS